MGPQWLTFDSKENLTGKTQHKRYTTNHYSPASFANRWFHSGEWRYLYLGLSISQSVDLSQPFLFFPHIVERIRASPREESRGEHAWLQARNRKLRNEWQPGSEHSAHSQTAHRNYQAYSVIPYSNRICFPLESDLVIRVFTNLVEKEW